MADVESSSSSSVVSQPPTSTSHINPIIPLIAADIHVEQTSSTNIIGSVVGIGGNNSNGATASSSTTSLLSTATSSSPSSSTSTSITNPINITSSTATATINQQQQQQTLSSNIGVATVAIAASSIHSPIQAATSSSSNIIGIGDSNNNTNNNNNIIGGNIIVGGGGGGGIVGGGGGIIGGGNNNLSSTNNNNNTTTNNNNMCRKLGLDDEPEAKRIKLDHNKTASSNSGQIEKLESRLLSALCCAVCLDLPKTAMYQCQMGHLMCAACFSHLLADGRCELSKSKLKQKARRKVKGLTTSLNNNSNNINNNHYYPNNNNNTSSISKIHKLKKTFNFISKSLRDQMATCPNCRIEISKSTATRNLAVEKAASELPSECQYCNIEYPYKSLERHEQYECQERPTNCKFNRIGCPWRGPAHETTEHESVCSHPHKSGYEVMSALEAYDAKLEKDKKVFSTLIDLLSYEKIIFNDLQLKPYRTDEYVHKLYYETSRFSAFNQQWVVKARINNSQRDPHQSNERTITYQLILKTKTSTPMSIHFFALKGPFSDMKVGTQIYKHDFTDQSAESDYYHLPLPDSSECNRLLSNKAINLRLLMFLLSK